METGDEASWAKSDAWLNVVQSAYLYFNISLFVHLCVCVTDMMSANEAQLCEKVAFPVNFRLFFNQFV